jgi:ABC-type nitrate/sulfonate/bicarbonate transport system substrate-binding protein
MKMLQGINRNRVRAKRGGQIVFGALLFLMAPLLVMGTETGGKPEKVELTIAYVSPSAAFTPLFVASDAGLFSKYGIHVKSQLLGPAIGQKALISEEIDSLVDGNQLITATLSGSRLKYFGAYMQRYAFQIWAVKGVTTIEQLKGKMVAVSALRGAIDSSTREALKKKGLIPDKDVKFVYNAQVPAILTALLTGTVSAGTISAPLNVQAKEAGLNFLLDIGELNIPGLQGAYGTTERFLRSHPNTLYAFTKAMAEAIVLAHKNSAAAKRAIAKFVKVEDPKILDASYDAYIPYLEMNLALRDEVIRAELNYLDDKEFPKVRSANVTEFFDNSFVENLEKSGFFASIGFGRPK